MSMRDVIRTVVQPLIRLSVEDLRALAESIVNPPSLAPAMSVIGGAIAKPPSRLPRSGRSIGQVDEIKTDPSQMLAYKP